LHFLDFVVVRLNRSGVAGVSGNKKAKEVVLEQSQVA
jgi:hypothetical protein